ncbi:hypothetical protein N0V83_008833 [Neocucurbitaria cava]|uniref:Uncharacterized protein n=1 Tax=Neocucurbitaria cava TaxID=798079 RepID=A0A9W8Y3S0_9PLEO|nr:hypothetical protein N0V83_008833 [Neocucurbitaria cava]
MNAEHAGTASRARRNPQFFKKHLAKAKKSVSIAAVFGQQPHKSKHIESTSHTRTNIPRQAEENATVVKLMSVKSQSSSRSPQRAGWRVSKNRSANLHPLAIEFKGNLQNRFQPEVATTNLVGCTETSDDYRRHLFKSTMLKVNATLETLLTSLFESTLQTVPTSGNGQDPTASPLKLSAPAKYERMAMKLYQPLSHYQLTLQRTNTRGEKECFQSTLETRMIHYEEHIAKRTKEIVQLQKDWEAVVGEIWKLGVSCLGEDTMEKLLFTYQDSVDPPLSSPSRATEAESTLFVPEQGGSTPPRKPKSSKSSKKRVTFEDSDAGDKYGATSLSKFPPEFLYQASRYDDQPLPIVAPLADEDIRDLEMKVKQLGIVHIEEFRKIEKDYQEYWRKKTAQLANVLKDE